MARAPQRRRSRGGPTRPAAAGEVYQDLAALQAALFSKSLGVFLRACVGRQAAEDLRQRAWGKIVRSWRPGRPGASSYVFRACTNTLVDYYRELGRRLETSTAEPPDITQPDPAPAPANALPTLATLCALKMPAADILIYHLRHGLDLPPRQIQTEADKPLEQLAEAIRAEYIAKGRLPPDEVMAAFEPLMRRVAGVVSLLPARYRSGTTAAISQCVHRVEHQLVLAIARKSNTRRTNTESTRS